MISRFISIYKYITLPKDEFLRKVIADIKKEERNRNFSMKGGFTLALAKK